MRRLGLSRGWWALALLACSAFTLPQAAMAQAPLEAKLFLKDPPPGATYNAGTAITIVLQVKANGAFKAPAGTSGTEFWRFVVFTDPAGNTVTNRVPHTHRHVVHCLSQGGVLLDRPIPGFLAEDVPASFFREDIVQDARQPDTYNLTRPGRWTAKALIPLEVVQGLGTICDQFPVQTLMSLGADRKGFLFESNSSVEFVIAGGNFVGFLSPLDKPNKTFKLGSAVDVKFQWLNASGAAIKDAVAHIAVAQAGQLLDPSVDLARGGSNPINQFRFASDKYVFQLDTKAFTATGLPGTGLWDIIVTIEDDASVHQTTILVTK